MAGPRPQRRRLAVICTAVSVSAVVAAAAAGAGAAEGQETCPAGGPCDAAQRLEPTARLPGETGDRGHYWPRARGRVGRTSVSPYVGPQNLTASLAWTWHHPAGRHGTVINGGPLIDERKNVYLTHINGVVKLSPDGRTLWTYDAPKHFSNTASINEDSVYITDSSGVVIALSIESGEERWRSRVAETGGGDISVVEAHSGIVLSTAEAGPLGFLGGAKIVVALNASSGDELWRFSPSSQLWNFLPMFTDNGTFVFQDQIGGVYHLGLADGRLLWQAGYKAGWMDTWCDGGTVLGPNGVVYAVSAAGPMEALRPDLPGDLRAYRLQDGELLWSHNFTMPPNSWPVVGRLREGARLSVVLPVGAQGGPPRIGHVIFGALGGGVNGIQLGAVLGLLVGAWRAVCRKGRCRQCCSTCCLCVLCALLLGLPVGAGWAYYSTGRMDINWKAQVWAFDAETGAVQWRWDPPTWVRHDVMGDAELFLPRAFRMVQPACIPNPWASATLDANGTIYTGYMNGKIYAIRDPNGDGRIEDEEVEELDAGAAFSHPGVAMAPGMMAISSCDTLFVFKS